RFVMTRSLAADAKGDVYINDWGLEKTYRGGREGVFLHTTRDSHAFGPDGRLYEVDYANASIVAYDTDGKGKVVARGLRGNDLVVAHNGNIYVTVDYESDKTPKGVWLVKPNGTTKVVDSDFAHARGVTLSPDQTLLYANDPHSHWVYSYQIQPDGTLQYKQRYYWLHVPDNADDNDEGAMCVDRGGRLYFVTRMGIQVCGQAGRVNASLPTP